MSEGPPAALLSVARFCLMRFREDSVFRNVSNSSAAILQNLSATSEATPCRLVQRRLRFYYLILIVFGRLAHLVCSLPCVPCRAVMIDFGRCNSVKGTACWSNQELER